VIAVAMRHIKPHEFRNTLFVIWFIRFRMKLCAFVIADIDIQVLNALWLLPFAGVGHLIGHRFHQQLLLRDSASFYRILGWILLGTAMVGISQALG
jgi:hypothetical protein